MSNRVVKVLHLRKLMLHIRYTRLHAVIDPRWHRIDVNFLHLLTWYSIIQGDRPFDVCVKFTFGYDNDLYYRLLDLQHLTIFWQKLAGLHLHCTLCTYHSMPWKVYNKHQCGNLKGETWSLENTASKNLPNYILS